jgi:hypothetical protein
MDILGAFDNSPSNGMAITVDNSGHLRAYHLVSDSAVADLDCSTDIGDGSWHHIVVCASSGSYLKGYVDGSLDGTDSSVSDPSDSSEPLCIGRAGTDHSWSGYLTGEIGGLKIFDRAIDSGGTDEITALYNSGDGVTYKQKSDRYTKFLAHFNGLDGATANGDASASIHSLTFNGNAQLDTAQKRFGTASLYCPDNTSYVSTPDSDDFYFDTDFTIDCWVRWTGAGDKVFSLRQYDDTNNNWGFYVSATYGLRFRWEQGGGTYVCEQGGTSGWSVDTWYHIAVTRSGNNFKVFRNGVILGTLTESASITNLSAPLQLGELVDADLWIDEFRVSKGIARWTESFTPPTQEE